MTSNSINSVLYSTKQEKEMSCHLYDPQTNYYVSSDLILMTLNSYLKHTIVHVHVHVIYLKIINLLIKIYKLKIAY